MAENTDKGFLQHILCFMLLPRIPSAYRHKYACILIEQCTLGNGILSYATLDEISFVQHPDFNKTNLPKI
jgi:hypothetical protein